MSTKLITLEQKLYMIKYENMTKQPSYFFPVVFLGVNLKKPIRDNVKKIKSNIKVR